MMTTMIYPILRRTNFETLKFKFHTQSVETREKILKLIKGIKIQGFYKNIHNQKAYVSIFQYIVSSLHSDLKVEKHYEEMYYYSDY